MLVFNTSMANSIKILLTPQNNTVANIYAFEDSTRYMISEPPNWPTINSVIELSPAVDMNPDYPLRVNFGLDTQIVHAKYSKTTLAEVGNLLAIHAGLFLFTFVVFGAILKPYENFQFQNSMLTSFYSVNSNVTGSQINKGEDIPTALAEMLSNRTHYKYDFCSYMLGKFSCCGVSCKAVREKRKLHDDSIRRLMAELDIVSFVRDKRLSSFAHKLTMNGH